MCQWQAYLDDASGHLNSHLGPLRPAQLPSAHCLTSIVQALSSAGGVACGCVGLPVCAQAASVDVNSASSRFLYMD